MEIKAYGGRNIFAALFSLSVIAFKISNLKLSILYEPSGIGTSSLGILGGDGSFFQIGIRLEIVLVLCASLKPSVVGIGDGFSSYILYRTIAKVNLRIICRTICFPRSSSRTAVLQLRRNISNLRR